MAAKRNRGNRAKRQDGHKRAEDLEGRLGRLAWKMRIPYGADARPLTRAERMGPRDERGGGEHEGHDFAARRRR
jgi:hypothetical protein